MVDDLRKAALEASGKVGTAWVYQKNGVRRSYVIPTNPQTATQQAWRYQFGDVQKELVTMGEELRSQLSGAKGYRWHALTIGEILEDGGAWWNEFASVFSGFDASDQEAWASYDGLEGQINPEGLVFFIAASSVYRLILWETGQKPFSEPAAGNVAEVAAEWPREQIMSGGLYTPIATPVQNVLSVTEFEFRWIRADGITFVSGILNIEVNSAGVLTKARIDLPFDATLESLVELTGNATVAISGDSGSVLADVMNDEAEIRFVPSMAGTQTWTMVFSY